MAFERNQEKCKILAKKLTGKIWLVLGKGGGGMHTMAGKSASGTAKIQIVITGRAPVAKNENGLDGQKKVWYSINVV